MEWFQQEDPLVQAAVVAGVLTFLSAAVTAAGTATSILLRHWLEGRHETRSLKQIQQETYRRYAEPLTAAATSLYWRLREVFEGHGGYYLLSAAGQTTFERYKVRTTQYRIAALLGWITGLKRELTLTDAQPDPSVAPLRTAISRVEAALAEGGHVEVERVRGIAELWNLELPDDLSRTAMTVEATLKRHLHRLETPVARSLSGNEKKQLADSIAAVLRTELDASIQDDLVSKTAEQASEILSTREAWIYRDWQSAIGHSMISNVERGARRFDVKSYGEYESLVAVPPELAVPWFQRLEELTIDLDIAGHTHTDARIKQLKNVYVSLAALIEDFHAAEPDRSSVDNTTLAAVQATRTNVEQLWPPQ